MKDIDTGKDICPFLKKKSDLFGRYLSITKQIKETFKDIEAADLLGLVSERQDCINKIEKVDSSMDKVIKASPKESRDLNESKGLVPDYLSKINGIMESVDLMDKELAVMVKDESETIKAELLNMRNVRHAARGYKKTGDFSPRFLDTVR